MVELNRNYKLKIFKLQYIAKLYIVNLYILEKIYNLPN